MNKFMDIVSGAFVHESAALSSADDLVTVVESPVVGSRKAQRITTTCKSRADGRIVSILVEEFQNDRLMMRQIDQYHPLRSSTREVFETDGSLITAETERTGADGMLTKVVVRGSGKSSTTRIVCGEVEARATERSILIETPQASYTYLVFEGKWSAFYKDMSMKTEVKSNFLRSPDAQLLGPDGITLIFKNGRLADMYLAQKPTSTAASEVSGIIE